MSNLNSALEIGRSALRAHQIGLNVAGDNIANVNTPGYARKTANLKTSITVAGLGTGVRVNSLTRARDRFLDTQFRFEASSVGELEALERAMTTIEAIFTELAGGGATEAGAIFDQSAGSALSGAFSRFFNAFQDLANNPESQTTRAAVREEATFLTDQFHRMHDQLTKLRDDLEVEVKDTIVEVNRLVEQIADLNTKILSEKRRSEDVVGSLEDERDRLIDELSELLGLRVREQADGTFTIATADGVLLVDQGRFNRLAGRSVNRNNAVVSDVALESTLEPIDSGSGRLKGLVAARDTKIVNFQNSLDALAATLVSEVNAIHAGGFGLDGSSGTDFFEPAQTTARQIAVSSAILSNLDKVAASSSAVGTGDGSNALALSDLRLKKVLGGGTQTLEEFYSELVGQVGADAKEVFTDAAAQRLVLEQVERHRESVRGVSINEEATGLILFQRAYQAAARIVTLVDEMMETALNM